MKNSKVLLSIVLITSLVIAQPSHATPNYMLAAAGAAVLIFKNPLIRIPLGLFFITKAYPEKTEELLNTVKQDIPIFCQKIKNIFEEQLKQNSEKNLNANPKEDMGDKPEENEEKILENKVRTDVE